MRDDPAAFPGRRISGTDPVSRRLRERGIGDLREAIRLVRDLPYGRPGDAADPLAVLAEGVGTCSTKHALLARLCDELGVADVQLTLGVYEMDALNTPPAGPVLAEHGLEAIPEAHCYLRYDGERFDFTGASADGVPIERFRHEEPIRPDQVGDYKERVHRAVLADWRTSLDRELDVADLWAIREACVAALSAADADGP